MVSICHDVASCKVVREDFNSIPYLKDISLLYAFEEFSKFSKKKTF